MNRIVDLSEQGKQVLLDLGVFIAAKHPAEHHKLSVTLTTIPTLDDFEKSKSMPPDAIEDIFIFYVRDQKLHDKIVDLLNKECGGYKLG